MLSKLLIQDQFYEFDEFDYKNLSYKSIQEKNVKNVKNEKIKYLNQIKKNNSNKSFSDEISIIELIDDKNYTIYDNEVKYKIFEDISSICKKL